MKNFQAVTIAIDDPTTGIDNGVWYKYAQWTCGIVKKNLGFDSVILDNEYLKYGVKNTSNFDSITSIKLVLFDIFPDADRIMFFDCDWRPVRKFDINQYCSQQEGLYFVEDRPECEFFRIKYGMKNPYFNSGFFIADRSYSVDLFKYAYQNYLSYERIHVEQCVMNQVFDGHVTYLDKRLNVTKVGIFPNKEVLAYHNGHNYQISVGGYPEVDWELG
jgi:lipopolysaccharide biosynthesis glycosyltransferase